MTTPLVGRLLAPGQACCLCGDSSPPEFLAAYQPAPTLSWRIATCPGCGSSSTYPLPCQAEVERFYQTSFNYRWYQDHLWAKQKDARQRTRELLAALPDAAAGMMLDYGGGLGYQAAALRNAGISCDIWDPYAKPGSSPPSGPFDVILCLHALEHSRDPARMLGEIQRLTRPGGLLVLAVPNHGSGGYARLGMRWIWAQPPLCHIFHFTAEGLRALLDRAGFDVRRTGYADRWDANAVADISLRPVFLLLERLWDGTPLLSRWPPYRRAVARITSALRFACLGVARREATAGDAELWIHAVKRS